MPHHLLAWYFTVALMLFSLWLTLFLQDDTASKSDWICWLIVIIAPFFWPVVLPVASWELANKALRSTYILD